MISKEEEEEEVVKNGASEFEEDFFFVQFNLFEKKNEKAANFFSDAIPQMKKKKLK